MQARKSDWLCVDQFLGRLASSVGGWSVGRFRWLSTEGAVICLAQGEVLRVLRAIPLPWDHMPDNSIPAPCEHGGKAAMLAGSGKMRDGRSPRVASTFVELTLPYPGLAMQSARPLARSTSPDFFRLTSAPAESRPTLRLRRSRRQIVALPDVGIADQFAVG